MPPPPLTPPPALGAPPAAANAARETRMYKIFAFLDVPYRSKYVFSFFIISLLYGFVLSIAYTTHQSTHQEPCPIGARYIIAEFARFEHTTLDRVPEPKGPVAGAKKGLPPIGSPGIVFLKPIQGSPGTGHRSLHRDLRPVPPGEFQRRCGTAGWHSRGCPICDSTASAPCGPPPCTVRASKAACTFLSPSPILRFRHTFPPAAAGRMHASRANAAAWARPRWHPSHPGSHPGRVR